MKTIFYKMMYTVIMFAGVFIGMVKGQEAKQKWVSKKKIRYEEKRSFYNNINSADAQVMLDEIEMSTYHSS